MELISQLKAHLLNDYATSDTVYASQETYQWFKNHSSAPLLAPSPPPLNKAVKLKAPLIEVKKQEIQTVMKQEFKLNPKKASHEDEAKSLLEKLKTRSEGVVFFDQPQVPKTKKTILLCTEEEKNTFSTLLEKLVLAIQKLSPCELVTTASKEEEVFIVASPEIGKGDLILPDLNELTNNKEVKQQVWNQLKECLSKYC